jgi:signal transduction histidine kinase
MSRGIAARLSDLLGGREVRVALLPGRRGERGAMVSVALAVDDGPDWLNIRVSRTDAADGPAPGVAVGLILLSSLLAVLGVGLWFLRGLTGPLRALEGAAQAAGAGDRTARVPVTGAREVRAVATAFNDMQTKIAALEADRLRMVGAVGHDLRTPITSLRIRAEMLDDAPLRDAMVQTLDEMAVMADGLVSYARSGAEAEAAGTVDLWPLLVRLAEARGAEVLPGPDATVRGRPVALGRAFGNLIDNALRYGGAARIGLTVEGGAAVVAITDDGPGLPEDRMAAVFDPFVRGEDSRSRETGGAGLGLSIARAIVQAHGGTIGLANGTPRGLVATVRLPLAGGH